jgi:hypothetical protein
MVFLLPQLPHFINLLIIKRLSACETVQYYRNITANITANEGEVRKEELFRSPEDGSPEVQSLQ